MLDMKIRDAQQLLINACQDMVNKGLTVGSWGNISMKIDKDCIAITPSGLGYTSMVPDDIVVVNLDGQKMMGRRTPSSETLLHLAIYKKHKNVKAIIHTHSTYATAIATLHRPLPPLVETCAHLAEGPVMVSEYARTGTKELADNCLKALGNNNAVLLANHGAVCCGSSLAEAISLAELLEKAAHIYCITASLGGGFSVDANNIKEIHKFYTEHYSKRQFGKEL